jgi:hypothetical protein
MGRRAAVCDGRYEWRAAVYGGRYGGAPRRMAAGAGGVRVFRRGDGLRPPAQVPNGLPCGRTPGRGVARGRAGGTVHAVETPSGRVPAAS